MARIDEGHSNRARPMTITTLEVAADHPAYAGHFPGTPVLPGVVLLDATLHALEQAGGASSARWQVSTAKFQSVVRPGEALTLEHETLANGSIKFAIRAGARAVANGLLAPDQPATGRTPTGKVRGEQS